MIKSDSKDIHNVEKTYTLRRKGSI